MNARDELADVFTGHTVGFGGFPKKLMRGHAQEIAERILAAGYRKPRTITAEEDLDALPNGSVVLSDVYRAHHGQAISFQRWEDGLWHRGARSGSTHPDNFLPVTVLHEPTP